MNDNGCESPQVEIRAESRSAVDGGPKPCVYLCQGWLDDDNGAERTLHPSTRGTAVTTYIVTVRARLAHPAPPMHILAASMQLMR